MPDPQQSRTVIENESEVPVNRADVDSSAPVPAGGMEKRNTDLAISVPPGVQFTLTFSGTGFIVGELQLSFSFVTPTPQFDPLKLHAPRHAPGPMKDPRSPERRMREFEQEQYRVAPYTPEHDSRSYPTRKRL